MVKRPALRHTAVALTVTALVSVTLPPLMSVGSSGRVIAAEARVRDWTTTQVLEGMLFLQGDFGEALVSRGAVGPLSTDQAAALHQALSDPDAAAIARSVATELQKAFPDSTAALMRAVKSSDPIAVQAAMGALGGEFLETPTMRRVTAEIRDADAGTYVPGEIGTDCGVLVWVVAGAVLVVTIAAVGLGVVALVSTVAVGSTKVAGQNAIRKASGSSAQAQEDQLTAVAIRVFHGE